jgi:hypothetical protein
MLCVMQQGSPAMASRQLFLVKILGRNRIILEWRSVPLGRIPAKGMHYIALGMTEMGLRDSG